MQSLPSSAWPSCMSRVPGLLLFKPQVSLWSLWLVRIRGVKMFGSPSDHMIKSYLSFMSRISWHTWVIFEVRVRIHDRPILLQLGLKLTKLLIPGERQVSISSWTFSWSLIIVSKQLTYKKDVKYEFSQKKTRTHSLNFLPPFTSSIVSSLLLRSVS